MSMYVLFFFVFLQSQTVNEYASIFYHVEYIGHTTVLGGTVSCSPAQMPVRERKEEDC